MTHSEWFLTILKIVAAFWGMLLVYDLCKRWIIARYSPAILPTVVMADGKMTIQVRSADQLKLIMQAIKEMGADSPSRSIN
jgi:hypothetical protein